MKKIYVFLVVTGILLFFGVQIASNQSKSNPISERQNQIGRYQYFSNSNGSLQGFLDTKEGFVLLCKDNEWEAWDLKRDLVIELAFQKLAQQDKLRIQAEKLPADQRKLYDAVVKSDEEEMESQVERIRK